MPIIALLTHQLRITDQVFLLRIEAFQVIKLIKLGICKRLFTIAIRDYIIVCYLYFVSKAVILKTTPFSHSFIITVKLK